MNLSGRSKSKMEADNYHKRMVVGAAGMVVVLSGMPRDGFGSALLSLPLTVWDRDTFMMIAMDYGTAGQGVFCNYGYFVMLSWINTIHGRNKMQENFDLKELMELLDTRQLRRLKEILMEMNEVDIASFIEELDSERTVVVFRMLSKEVASDVFANLPWKSRSISLTALRTMS